MWLRSKIFFTIIICCELSCLPLIWRKINHFIHFSGRHSSEREPRVCQFDFWTERKVFFDDFLSHRNASNLIFSKRIFLFYFMLSGYNKQIIIEHVCVFFDFAVLILAPIRKSCESHNQCNWNCLLYLNKIKQREKKS